MSNLDAMLLAAADDPRDVPTLLAYADALEEAGDREKAAMLRRYARSLGRGEASASMRMAWGLDFLFKALKLREDEPDEPAKE